MPHFQPFLLTSVAGLTFVAAFACAGGTPLADVQPVPEAQGPPAFELAPDDASADLEPPSPSPDALVTPPSAEAVAQTPTPTPASSSASRKVDFVFVIDNTNGMQDEQLRLASGFDRFIERVQQDLGVDDFRVMVIDTDADDAAPGSTLSELRDSLNGDEAASAPSCEEALGAGKRRTADGADCGLVSDIRYLGSAEADLTSSFACLAQVGTSGDDDARAIDALLAALSTPLVGPGGCNQAFLRDDAALVVTLLSNDDDSDSEDQPEDWRAALLAAKAGNGAAIALLGILGDNNLDGGLPGGPCSNSAADGSPRLQRFVESFELGTLGSSCSTDYAVFFEQALPFVDAAADGVEAATTPIASVSTAL